MNRKRETPRTDAVLNTFNGNAAKLAADLATHAEELEKELAIYKKAILKWEDEMLSTAETSCKDHRLTLKVHGDTIRSCVEDLRTQIQKTKNENN